MNGQELVRMLEGALSGERALDSATQLTRFYRSPGASGYHRATDFVADLFRANGLDRVWSERYPLDGRTQYMNVPMPLAWEPVDAELRVGSPHRQTTGVLRRLTRRACPGGRRPHRRAARRWSWWTWAPASDRRTTRAGTCEGKAVLIRGTTRPGGFGHAATLAMEHGAAGIITDYLLYQTEPFRTRESLPNPVQLLRMPSNLPSAWALAVNYHAAEHLASLARQGPVQVWADVQARSFEGEAQNLFADITGTDEHGQIVQFVAHSTAGTKPGANCASGPALMAEMGRVISDLISSGRIPRPRRTIRFLVNVEGHGTKQLRPQPPRGHRADHRLDCPRQRGPRSAKVQVRPALLPLPRFASELHQRLLRGPHGVHAERDALGCSAKATAFRSSTSPTFLTRPGATITTTPPLECHRRCSCPGRTCTSTPTT